MKTDVLVRNTNLLSHSLVIVRVILVLLSAQLTTVGGETVFAPSTSDFAVTFSAQPTVDEFDFVTTDGVALKGTRAELRATDSFQRVEVVPMPRGFGEKETRESGISKLRDYAKHNGLTAPEFKWESTTLGRKASVRGTKILEDGAKQRAVTFEAVFYYGDTSLACLYVGGPSESYPPTRVIKFLNSVTKNSKKK